MSVPPALVGGPPPGLAGPPGLGGPPPMAPPPPALPPNLPTDQLQALATQLAAEGAQIQGAAQSALMQLTAQLAQQPNAMSAGAVSEPGPLTAGAGAPPPDDLGGF